MERVAFLVERTGERIECLLNPATFTITRQAGLRPLRTLAASVMPAPDADDTLLATGGGSTELVLELLFDVSKQTTQRPEASVQALTAPLWRLAENSDDSEGHGRPPLVRFVWGKAWNISAIVVSVAERFDQFTAQGLPTRSWIKLRLLRCSAATPYAPESVPTLDRETEDELSRALEALSPDDIRVHEVAGENTDGEGALGNVEGIDLLAFRYLGNPGSWRILAEFNQILDPARIPVGTLLRIPPLLRSR